MKYKLAESLRDYVNNKHTQEECIGFADGFEKACEFANQWISVEDELPIEGYAVLIWDMPFLDGNSAVAFYDIDDNEWSLFHAQTSSNPIKKPTHWMPLPKPPKSK